MANNELNPNATLDDLLDGTLDDLNDTPTFEPFRIGAHKVKISWEITSADKDNHKIPVIKLNATLIEHMELTNPEDKAQEAGSKTNVSFWLKKVDEGKLVRNDQGEGQWKDILASLRTGLNLPDTTTNREVMAATEGMEVMLVTDIRKVKSKDTGEIKEYGSFKQVAVI
jgi:CRISPR/Cas system CSM-associated protein Csm2 small subunit